MAEDLRIDFSLDRGERYVQLLPQLEALVSEETSIVANLANIMAGIKESFGFLWVGVYLVQDNMLVLGPFQGPVACTRIAKGKGVCGTAWAENRTIIVENVDEFPGHIACSSASRSEIVIPLRNPENQVIGVLDIDSIQLAEFNINDQIHLEKICKLIEKCMLHES